MNLIELVNVLAWDVCFVVDCINLFMKGEDFGKNIIVIFQNWASDEPMSLNW